MATAKKAAKAAKGAAKRGNGHDDDFDQGGPDGPSKQRGAGDNSKKFDGDELAELLETIDAAEARIAKRAEEASKKSEPDRKLIADAKKDMVASGYPSTELATIIRRHKLQRKLATVDAKLDDDQKETFASMVEALGEFAETPLGQAAVSRGGRGRGANA